MAANTAGKQSPRGKPFEPGRSGNPAGKPAGARNKATLALEQLIEGKAQVITKTCLTRAEAGDPMALRLMIERILPVRKGRPVQFDMPPMDGPADLVGALGGILRAVAAGNLTPDEGAIIAGIMDTKRRAHDTAELTARIDAIEKIQSGGRA